MSTIAFLGLGRMGAPMARRVLDAGYDLTVWNRTPGRVQPLLAAGATGARTPAEAAAGADIVLTMLATPRAVEEVIFGPDGAAEGIKPQACLVGSQNTSAVGAQNGGGGRFPHWPLLFQLLFQLLSQRRSSFQSLFHRPSSPRP